MIRFKSRSVLPEKMDQPGVSSEEIHKALKELSIINRLLGGYSVMLSALNKICSKDKHYKIVDVGSGGGDMVRQCNKWAVQKNYPLIFYGIDMNKEMTEYAIANLPSDASIKFMTMNVFDPGIKVLNPDIFMNSLFCHHFDDDDLETLVRNLFENARVAVIINDLHRHWFAFYSIKFITSLFSKSYLVKYDGPLSVLRSLTRKEWKIILNKAGISKYSIQWKWAWRWQIILYK